MVIHTAGEPGHIPNKPLHIAQETNQTKVCRNAPASSFGLTDFWPAVDVVTGFSLNGNPNAYLLAPPRPLPPLSPAPFLAIYPGGILDVIMWHCQQSRPRSALENRRLINQLVSARLQRFLVDEDEYLKRYTTWQQHSSKVQILKEAMLDDTIAAECRKRLPEALRVEAESRRKFVDSARACFNFIKELEYNQNRCFELDEGVLEELRMNKELIQDLWSCFAEATSTSSGLLSMAQRI